MNKAFPPDESRLSPTKTLLPLLSPLFGITDLTITFSHSLPPSSTPDRHHQQQSVSTPPPLSPENSNSSNTAIAHQILSTSIFGRHKLGQINTSELYFLYCMTSHCWSYPGFATFFLDKCHSIRTKTTGDICIGGLITLIGLGVGLQFLESEYVPVDDPPLYLLDCIALTKMELLVPINNHHYSWLNHVKQPVYTLPNISISAFSTSDPETWFLPEELHDDDTTTNDEIQVDNANPDSPFEAKDHYDLLIRQLPPPFYGQPLGVHFEPQHEYHCYPQHNDPEPEPDFPLDIYS
ncbi:unnamed protein product [Lactuca saligna]|uniref:Uncharacterized protein n=1 Tax=Lactuca saligna TaxID=75948 RepID=A0AA36A5Z0_LACSI|nr:unnamed protein product [Lactuca saligna]